MAVAVIVVFRGSDLIEMIPRATIMKRKVPLRLPIHEDSSQNLRSATRPQIESVFKFV